MKRVLSLVIICSFMFAKDALAIAIHPALQADLLKLVSHGAVWVKAVKEEMQDAQEIREAGINAYYTSQLAKTEEHKKIAEKQTALYFKKVKKEQEKVPNPEISENLKKSLSQVIFTLIATFSAASSQQNAIIVNEVPVIFPIK